MIHVGNKESHLDSSSRRIRSRLRIGKKWFGSIREGSDCKAIIGVQIFFPILAYFLCWNFIYIWVSMFYLDFKSYCNGLGPKSSYLGLEIFYDWIMGLAQSQSN
jgi:hypothetical protein